MRRPRPISEYLHVGALVVVVLLIGVSLVSQGNADWYSGDNFYNAQVVWFLVGGLAFILVAMVDLRLVERLSYVIYGLCVVGLLLTALVGTEVNHSQRWLRFLGMNIQVSEIAKLGVIIALSRFFHDRGEHTPPATGPAESSMSMRHLLKPAFMVALPCALILAQPDLGTALVIGLVSLSMMLYQGIQRRTATALILVALVGVPTAWEYGGLREYQKDRVRLWVNPDWFKFDQESGTVATGRNLQSEQAIWAIGSGKFWGRGSREGARSRLKYLPEMHTDMIIATFAEEQGFLGCSLLLGLYWFLMLWGLRTAKDARDTFCSLFAVGITAMLTWQVFINVGMVAGLLPIVGLPLPFLSYGGSAAVTLMLGLGLLFNIGLKRGRL